MLEITGERELYGDRWIVLKEKRYRRAGGPPGRQGRPEGQWTYVERAGRRKAVVVIPVTRQTGSLILVRQFRVPFERDVLEFPAGLADPGEDPARTAERELLEETGYGGRVLEVGPEVATTAGLATETVSFVAMEVGEEPLAAPAHEGSEQIEVLKVPPESFGSFLEDCRRQGLLVDAKTYLYMKANAR